MVMQISGNSPESQGSSMLSKPRKAQISGDRTHGLEPIPRGGWKALWSDITNFERVDVECMMTEN